MPNTEERADDQARAQVSSIVAMVAALSVDYDRLGELREKARAGHYVAGWNMPGYMPDSEPAGFDTCDEARAYIEEQLRDLAGNAMQDDTRSNDETDAEEASHIEAADALRDAIGGRDSDYGRTVGIWHYWITHMPGMLADPDEAKELEDLESAAGECESEDAAREAIQEDALSVEVRSGWHSLGEKLEPSEFRIVLCTGGPHVELQGELDEHNEPERVRVLYRDWGTSGELFDFDRDAVLTYCRQFYFGE